MPAIFRFSDSDWGWVFWADVAEMFVRDPQNLLHSFWRLSRLTTFRTTKDIEQLGLLEWRYNNGVLVQSRISEEHYITPGPDYDKIYVAAGFARQVIDLCRQGVPSVHWAFFTAANSELKEYLTDALYYAEYGYGPRWVVIRADYASDKTPRIKPKRLF